MQSTPKLNSTVKGPDVPIWLRFNVRVDGKRSRLHLIAPDGSTISLSIALKQTAPDILESRVTGLEAREPTSCNGRCSPPTVTSAAAKSISR